MSFDRLRQKFREEKRNALIRSQLAEKLASTPVGRLASEVSAVSRSRRATTATAERLRRQFETLVGNAPRDAVTKTRIASQIEEIERYAKSPGGVWGWMQKTFGPVADTIRGLLRPGGKQQMNREIEAAAELLNALGASQSGAKGKRVSITAEDEEARQRAERVMRGLGFDVEQPAPVERFKPAIEPDPTEGMTRKYLGGFSVYFDPNDPIVTGAMIPVNSSNVHSIGFDWNDKAPNSGTLKVRFLDSSGKTRTGKGGPTYHYHDVHPRVFLEFQKASSKGKFVWDRLRVRGTVSGHQYRYSLMRLASSGYVPRRAVRIGDAEWYVKRTVKTAAGATLKSQLQDRMVRILRSDQLRLPKDTFNRGR